MFTIINYEFMILSMINNILISFQIINNKIMQLKIIFIIMQLELNMQINYLALVFHHLTNYILHLF